MTDGPRIIAVPDLEPKTHLFGVGKYVLQGKEAMPQVVNDFLIRNQISGANVNYHDGVRIARVNWADSELVFYSEEGKEESNPVIGIPIAQQSGTIRRDRWGADGTIKGKKIKLEAIVEIERNGGMPLTTKAEAKRTDWNPYWFVVCANKQ